jgi:AsmA protein
MFDPADTTMTKPSKKTPPPAQGEAQAKPGSLKLALLGLYGVTGLTLSYVSPIKLPFAEGYAKDHWRHALGGLLLVLALFAGAIGLAIYLLDANDFKSQIVDYVKTHKQRDLVLDGDIRVAYFPSLGLDTGKMSLSQRNSSQKFASVDNARLYVAWWPLLRMQLQVERVVLDGLHANVIRNKDGSTNFDDLLVTADQLGDVKFEVEKIRVIDSSVNFRDEASSVALSLHDLELETGRLADATAGQVSTSFRLESNQPHLDARVKLQGHVLYDRAHDRLEVANFEGQAQGEADGINSLALDFSGSLMAHPATQQLELDKFSATAKGKLEQQNFEARLTAASLKLAKDQWHGTALTLGASLLQDGRNLTASLEVPAFETDTKTFRSENVLAAFELPRSGRWLQGKFNSPVSFDFETRQLQLDAMTGNWSGSHPLLAGKLNASASGKLLANWPAQEIKLDFKTRIDDSEFTGNVQLQDFKTPAYAFDVAVNTLDLDRYLVSDWAKRFQDEALPFDFSGLKALNLRGKLRSDEFKLAKLKTRQLLAEIRADPSTLSIEPIEAHLYGGSLQGGLRIAAADVPRITLRQRLSGVLLDALLADVLPSETRLTGKGNLAFDLTAEGKNIAELRKSLNGSASLALTRGTLAGLNLTEALVAGKGQLGIQGAERSDSVRLTESTPYTELKASIDIVQGKAYSGDLLMKSPLFTSKGEAEIALETGQLTGQLSTTVASGLKRSSAGELAELSGISVPLRISGPWPTATVTYSLGEASGGNLARLVKANMSKVAASAADSSRTAGK